MKVLIISDTHGHQNLLEEILNRVGPIDSLIHCGDIEGQEDYFAALTNGPSYFVAGNNDYFSMLEREREFELGGQRIFLTHGHNYGVSMNTQCIKDEGQSRNADIVMFGHTHKPCLEYYKDIILLNPGSLTYPRQTGRKPSFMILDINKDGKIHFTTKYIKNL